MSHQRTQAITSYGWTAIPRKTSTLLSQSPTTTPAPPLTVSDLPTPTTPLSQSIQAYAHTHLPIETYNHSLRVFHYGHAILTHSFPSWLSPSFLETYFITCLLHDIGTTDANIYSTLLSFEFYGGFLVLDVLKKEGAPVEQAESVAEAVMRHQDLGDTGTLTRIGGLVQLATIFDNMGGNPQLVAGETIEVSSVRNGYGEERREEDIC